MFYSFFPGRLFQSFLLQMQKLTGLPFISGSTHIRPHGCWQHFNSPSQSWSTEHSVLQSDLSSIGAGQTPILSDMKRAHAKLNIIIPRLYSAWASFTCTR